MLCVVYLEPATVAAWPLCTHSSMLNSLLGFPNAAMIQLHTCLCVCSNPDYPHMLWGQAAEFMSPWPAPPQSHPHTVIYSINITASELFLSSQPLTVRRGTTPRNFWQCDWKWASKLRMKPWCLGWTQQFWFCTVTWFCETPHLPNQNRKPVFKCFILACILFKWLMDCLCWLHLPVVNAQTFGFIDANIYSEFILIFCLWKKSESLKTTNAYNVMISSISASKTVLRTFTVPKIR